MQFLQNLNREQLARQGAVLGGIALLFALVFYLIEQEITSPVFAGIVVGVLGIGGWILIAPQEVSDWINGRQVYYSTGTVLLSLVIIGVVATGYAIVARQNILIDMTPYGEYTLDSTSVQSINQLENRLEGTEFRAQIVGFYPRDEQRERALADTILRQFEAESNGYIDVVYIDPDEEPIEARSYGYGVNESGVFVGPLFLTYVDADGNPARGAFEVIGEANERNIASAILRLSTAGQFTIYFSTGHLEYSPEDTGDFGISVIYNGLPGAGINVNTVDLTQVEVVPEDADALIIAGPRIPFSEADVAKIDVYLQRGGHVMITADPPYIDSPPTLETNNVFMLETNPFSAYLWENYGVRFREDLISDQGSFTGSEINLLVDSLDTRHPALVNFPTAAIILRLARSIELTDNTTRNASPFVLEPLMFTSSDSFGERGNVDNPDGEHPLRALFFDPTIEFTAGVDVPGQLITGVAVRLRNESEQDITPRLLLVGDTDWLSNSNIRSESDLSATGNVFLWGRLVEWVLDENTVSLPDARIRNDLLPVAVDEQQQSRIWLLTLGLLPAIVLGAGVLIWGIRQRN